MDVKTIPKLWGVGVVKITLVQKWDPIKKTPVTLESQLSAKNE